MTLNDTKHPPVHPLYAEFLRQQKSAPPLESLGIEEFREIQNNRLSKLGVPLPEVNAKELTVQSNGKSVELHIIRPVGSENETLPAILYLHGGGFFSGSKHSHAKIIRDLCVKAHMAVVFVEYSLSPEVKFPVALEECYAALLWLHNNASSINVNPDQIAVVGDSAGGNLSAALPILAKERDHGNIIKAQVLIYPACAATREAFESYEIFGNGDYITSKKDTDKMSAIYYSEPPLELNNKLATPLLATKEELQGLPPALVFTAESDMFRDEAEEYARRLMDAGVATTAVRVLGTIHGYIMIPFDTPQYRFTISTIARQLKDTFALN